MNPKLMAMLRAKKSAKVEEPETEDNPMEEASEGKDVHYHMKQVGLHLDKGIKGTRRGSKISMKLAKHHHDMACGMMGDKR